MLFGVKEEPIGRPGMFIRMRASGMRASGMRAPGMRAPGMGAPGMSAGASAGATTPASLTGPFCSADDSGAALTGSLVSAAGWGDVSGAVVAGSLVAAAGSDVSGAVAAGSVVSAAGWADFLPLPVARADLLVSATADSVSTIASASPPAGRTDSLALATPVYTQDMRATANVTASGRIVPNRVIVIRAIPARPTA
jgi:hypothetical protein